MTKVLRATAGVGFVLAAMSLTIEGVGSTQQPAAAPDPKLIAYGKHLAGECTACHRIDGVDNGIPSITGWDPAEFVATMIFYRNGERTNPAMVSVAQSMDDDQYKALAAFYGSLPKAPRGPKRPTRQ